MTVEPVFGCVGSDVSQSTSATLAGGQLATLKVRTRPPGPPDPPQSPAIEDDQINQKNVLIRYLETLVNYYSIKMATRDANRHIKWDSDPWLRCLSERQDA